MRFISAVALGASTAAANNPPAGVPITTTTTTSTTDATTTSTGTTTATGTATGGAATTAAATTAAGPTVAGACPLDHTALGLPEPTAYIHFTDGAAKDCVSDVACHVENGAAAEGIGAFAQSGAIEISGAGSYVSCPHHAGQNAAANKALSVSWWEYRLPSTSADQHLCPHDHVGAGEVHGLWGKGGADKDTCMRHLGVWRNDIGNVYLYHRGNQGGRNAEHPHNTPKEEWVHYVLTSPAMAADGTQDQTRVYVNGALLEEAELSGDYSGADYSGAAWDLMSGADPLFIGICPGAWGSPPPSTLVGSASEVNVQSWAHSRFGEFKVYQTELTAEQVASVCEAEKGEPCGGLTHGENPGFGICSDPCDMEDPWPELGCSEGGNGGEQDSVFDDFPSEDDRCYDCLNTYEGAAICWCPIDENEDCTCTPADEVEEDGSGAAGMAAGAAALLALGWCL